MAQLRGSAFQSEAHLARALRGLESGGGRGRGRRGDGRPESAAPREPADAVGLLMSLNAGEDAMNCRLWADAARTWLQAAANVRRFGAVVAHPRTGVPLENPCLKIRDAAARQLLRFELRGTERALARLEAEIAAEGAGGA